MLKNKIVTCSLLASFLLSAVGCKNLPGTKEEQGAVIGGLGGAAAGAAVGGKQRPRCLNSIQGAWWRPGWLAHPTPYTQHPTLDIIQSPCPDPKSGGDWS